MTIRKLACLAFLWLLVPGCYFRPKTEIPMPSKWSGDPEPGDRLMLFLPGMGDRIGVFEREGFQEMAHSFPAVTEHVVMVELDAHFGYYPKGILVPRVREDVLARYPDHKVTLVGTSLGGFGAQVLARNLSGQVDRLVLIAPFMGGRGLIRRIQAEGLAVKEGDSGVDREALLNWRFLLEAAKTGQPEVTILVGEDDRLRRGIEVLTQKAPQIEMVVLPGGHKWRVWKQLWQRWLESRSENMNGSR